MTPKPAQKATWAERRRIVYVDPSLYQDLQKCLEREAEPRTVSQWFREEARKLVERRQRKR